MNKYTDWYKAHRAIYHSQKGTKGWTWLTRMFEVLNLLVNTTELDKAKILSGKIRLLIPGAKEEFDALAKLFDAACEDLDAIEKANHVDDKDDIMAGTKQWAAERRAAGYGVDEIDVAKLFLRRYPLAENGYDISSGDLQWYAHDLVAAGVQLPVQANIVNAIYAHLITKGWGHDATAKPNKADETYDLIHPVTKKRMAWLDAIYAEQEREQRELDSEDGVTPSDEAVTCSLCKQKCDADTAHLHQDEYIGECCWDERLKASE